MLAAAVVVIAAVCVLELDRSASDSDIVGVGRVLARPWVVHAPPLLLMCTSTEFRSNPEGCECSKTCKCKIIHV